MAIQGRGQGTEKYKEKIEKQKLQRGILTWKTVKRFFRRWREIVKFVFIALVLGTFFVTGCHVVNQKLGLEDDNYLEELVESCLETQIGIPLDLTPENPDRYNIPLKKF
jgi:hypothetical protein